MIEAIELEVYPSSADGSKKRFHISFKLKNHRHADLHLRNDADLLEVIHELTNLIQDFIRNA